MFPSGRSRPPSRFPSQVWGLRLRVNRCCRDSKGCPCGPRWPWRPATYRRPLIRRRRRRPQIPPRQGPQRQQRLTKRPPRPRRKGHRRQNRRLSASPNPNHRPQPQRRPSFAPPKSASKFQAPSQAAALKAAPAAAAAAKADVARSAGPEPASKPATENGAPAVAASAKTTPTQTKQVTEESAKVKTKPAEKTAEKPEARPTKSESDQESVPSFGAMQLPNSSFAGSLKVKLGIAIAILVVACSTWLGWGGKSHKPTASNSAASADGSGPSIIMGEGGWVEGWGGDPSGIHAGRQITLYRPSLKLSDYRIEFQGNIETQSIGWVFRAADPGNYYALKLMAVSSGLTPKLALFKYLVINGRQTQVGRVPIDLTLRADSVFQYSDGRARPAIQHLHPRAAGGRLDRRSVKGRRRWLPQ